MDRTELHIADEIRLIGTLAELAPVTRVDEYELPSSSPLTDLIAETFWAAVRGVAPHPRGGIDVRLDGYGPAAGEKVWMRYRQASGKNAREITRTMREELQELYKYRELLYMITYRDIKVRYKQSIMGFLWAILMPILIVMSGVVVRYAYAMVSHAPLKTADIASVAIKSVPWAFIVASIRFTCNSLTGNHDLGYKIYFPKEIFPMAAVLACLFDFFVASCGFDYLPDLHEDWLERLSSLGSGADCHHGPVLHRDRHDRLGGQPFLSRRKVHR